MNVARRCFIRPKDGEWREVTAENIINASRSFKGQPEKIQHAILAHHLGIEGEFEIEVRVLESGVWTTDRSAKGTTTVLADARK